MNHEPLHQSSLLRIVTTLIIALSGGTFFQLLHVPVPWFLGPMTGVLIGSRFSRISLYWPAKLRNTGMIIVGYSMGLSFSVKTLHQILIQLPFIVLLTILLIAASSIIALLVSKLSGIDYPTILTGSIPGGLSQMVLLAEETKGIDITVVTFLQVTRQMMIIFLVPLYIFNPLFGINRSQLLPPHMFKEAEWGLWFPNMCIFAGACLLCAFLGRKIKMPTSYLVGPILGTAILTISGLQGPSLPVPVIGLSQFMIGTYVGLLLKPEQLASKAKIVFLSLLSGLFLLLTSLVLSLFLIVFYGASYSTSYLSLAPGGMDQMGILAHEVNANLSMVVGFQLFRLFFIFFVIPPVLKLVFKKVIKRSDTSLSK